MPEEINNLMEEVTAGSTSKDHKQAIKDRLKQIRDLFRISKYTRSRTGDSSVAQNTAGVGLMGLFTAGWFWVLACLLLVVGAILAALGHVLESTGGSRSRR
jgi:Flp pilus assembly protein TadB